MADHNICDACETVSHCRQHGCIPLTPVAAKDGAAGQGQAGAVARYSFVCGGGCGVCAVKVTPFEYERTETLEGEHLGSKYQPQIVSACCGAEVHVYDNEADHWGAQVALATEK